MELTKTWSLQDGAESLVGQGGYMQRAGNNLRPTATVRESYTSVHPIPSRLS